MRAEGKATGPVREGVVEEVTSTTLRVRLPKGLDDVGGTFASRGEGQGKAGKREPTPY